VKILAPILVLTVLLLAVLALEDERPRADVVWVHATDLFTLDPQKMSYQHDLRAARALYEPLLSLSPDGEIEPAAAEKWTLSADRRTYTFGLREGLTFSNGDPVTASDFVYAWRRAILPDTAAKYSSLFFHIKGARAFFDWRAKTLAAGDAIPHEEVLAKFDEMVGLRAIEDRTLEVVLTQPVPYFLDLCAFGTFSPIHSASVRAATSIDPQTGRIKEDPAWLKPGSLISNGPYTLERWRYKRDVRLEKNPKYWNAANVRNDSIEMLVIEDPNTAILAFEAGVVDWLPNVLAEYRADMVEQRVAYEVRHREALDAAIAKGASLDEALAAMAEPRPDERRNVHVLDAFGTDFFQFNCRETLSDGRANPLSHSGVRRALALATDKQAIVERVTRLNERVSGSFVPAGSIAGYTAPKGLGHNPEQARRELAQAGWTLVNGQLVNAAGEAFPTLEILYSTGSPRYEDISLALRDMWRRELSLAVEIDGKPGNEYRAALEAGNFMVARGGWYGDYGDPTTFLDLNKTGDGNNHRGFSNEAYDRLLDAAATESDPEKRFRLLEEAETLLVEVELPILPLCTYATLYMYEPGEFTGLTHHPRLEQYPHRLHSGRKDS
jgi:oligopeptide transport system substrate-binding protein